MFSWGAGAGANTTTMARAKAKAESTHESTHLTLKVQMDQHEVLFRIRKDAPLDKLMRAYCDKIGIKDDAVRFSFDGKRVKGLQTPNDYQMDDGDVIDAWIEQLGGGKW